MDTTNSTLINQPQIKPYVKPKRNLRKEIGKCKYFYILFLPAVAFYIIFSYVPMYGTVLAFKEFDFSKGIIRSPWTSMGGLQHFYDIMSNADFKRSFINTLLISFGRILYEFPIPIVLALLINEIRNSKFKRISQTIFTFPHFVSWVIGAGIFFNLLSSDGIINQIIAAAGGEKITFLTSTAIFRPLLYVSSNWKEAGWGTIIYLAAITGINPELYEAAIVDGAKRFQLMRYITWPAIRSVIRIMLILAIASIMNAGFDQIFNMYNAAVYVVADIIDTYVYRRTFITGLDLASSTAVGLFKSVINFIMLISANTIIKKTTGRAIY